MEVQSGPWPNSLEQTDLCGMTLLDSGCLFLDIAIKINLMLSHLFIRFAIETETQGFSHNWREVLATKDPHPL